MFEREEYDRYSRHLLLSEVGMEGQLKLKAASVCVVGAGGLGSPVAFYLALAGVGRLGIVDFDTVDASNLQRQILHATPDIGRLKLDSARDKLAAANPFICLELHNARLTRDNALQLLGNYDVIVDGTDNFATRYLLNDACALLRKPLVYGSIFRFAGQVGVFDMREGARSPCYRCLYPAPPPPELVPNCAEAGVLGVLPGVIGSLQASETLKIILGIGTTLAGRLLLFDALTARFSDIRIPKNPSCPVCGAHPTITELIDYDAFCSPALQRPTADEITATELRERMRHNARLALVDVREAWEHEQVNIPGSRLIPLGELEARASELDPKRETVFYCASGSRSAKALSIAREHGFANAAHLAGGIRAWIAHGERRHS